MSSGKDGTRHGRRGRQLLGDRVTCHPHMPRPGLGLSPIGWSAEVAHQSMGGRAYEHVPERRVSRSSARADPSDGGGALPAAARAVFLNTVDAGDASRKECGKKNNDGDTDCDPGKCPGSCDLALG
jgi:hypothetical protein